MRHDYQISRRRLEPTTSVKNTFSPIYVHMFTSISVNSGVFKFSHLTLALVGSASLGHFAHVYLRVHLRRVTALWKLDSTFQCTNLLDLLVNSYSEHSTLVLMAVF